MSFLSSMSQQAGETEGRVTEEEIQALREDVYKMERVNVKERAESRGLWRRQLLEFRTSILLTEGLGLGVLSSSFPQGWLSVAQTLREVRRLQGSQVLPWYMGRYRKGLQMLLGTEDHVRDKK